MSVTPSEPSPAYRKGVSSGGLLFGSAFLVGTALIFTLLMQPRAEYSTASEIPMPSLPLTYPPTRIDDASDVYFGTRVADPYRWLENGKSPEVQKWLAAENKVARSYLDALPGRAELEKRYAQLLRIDTI